MTLLDFDSKVNAMTPAYACKLNLISWTITVNIQKIDRLALKTYKMGTAEFLVYNKLNKAWFLKRFFC